MTELRLGQVALEDPHLAAGLEHAQVLAEGRDQVGHVAQRDAHGDEVELAGLERQRFGDAARERAAEDLARLAEHALAGIDAEHLAARRDQARGALRDGGGADRHVEHAHAGLQAGAAEREAAVPEAAVAEDLLDRVVVARRLVEQVVDVATPFRVGVVVLEQRRVGRDRVVVLGGFWRRAHALFVPGWPELLHPGARSGS